MFGALVDMQRAVEVKQVISGLCRLLAATGLQAVPAPETFRRAKFGGGPEEEGRESQLWQLLVDILQTASVVSSEVSAQLGGERRRLVAAGLWQTGYQADWMCGTEGGEGRRVSSRDLLLALGWLLAAGALERLLMQRVQKLDKTLLTLTPISTQFSTELQFNSASVRRLQWLTSCLRYEGRTLLSMQEERTRLLHAVSLASLPSSVSADKSSTVLSEDCVRKRQLCELLQLYLNWKQVEKVFWTWMDSVVDCHLTDPVVEKPTHSPSGSARVCHHGNRGLEKLENMLLSLPTGQAGQTRGRGHAEDRGGSGDRLQGGSDTSSLPPPLPSPSSLPCIPHVYRAKLQTERPVRSRSHPAAGPRGGVGALDELPASQAEQLLLQTEALLLESRDRQRLANRMQLQEMAGRLDQLVLIP